MGISTNGQICFGILFPEEYAFPWDKYGDEEEWWLKDVLKYKPPFEIFDSKGEYIDGVKPPKETIDKYYEYRRNFINKSNAFPVDIVNCCSCDYPIYIMSVKSSFMFCYRGNPADFDLKDLFVSQDDRDKLIQFCEMYCKTDEDFPVMEPKWYLSSLYC